MMKKPKSALAIGLKMMRKCCGCVARFDNGVPQLPQTANVLECVGETTTGLKLILANLSF